MVAVRRGCVGERGPIRGPPVGRAQARDRPAPASMPHTVLLPVWAKNPQARPQKVRNDGAVNSGPKTASKLASETGSGSVTSGIIAENPGSPPIPRRSCPAGTRRRRPARPATPPSPPRGGPPDRSHHGQRARHTRPADPDRDDPADHRPRHARLAPPRRAHRAPPRTVLLHLCRVPSCPATANPRRSCACATRDQPAAGPSGSTWPAAASTQRPSCPPPSGPRPALPKKGPMTPSSSTRALNLAADSAHPAPEDTAKTTKMRNTS